MLVALGGVLLGVCTLLLTDTQVLAFTRGVQQSQPQDVSATAFLGTISGPDARGVRDDAASVVRSTMAPLGSTTTTNATTVLRRVDDTKSRAYLGAGDDLDRRVVLSSGRAPRPGSALPEALVPETAARPLGLRLGEQLTVAAETSSSGGTRPVTLTVVGTYRPRDLASWVLDPLKGGGFDPRYTSGGLVTPAYGPFLVPLPTLLDGSSTVDAMQVTAAPSRTRATRQSVAAVLTALNGADRQLSAVLGDRVAFSRLGSDLPRTVASIDAQQLTTSSTVLTVVLLAATVTVAALLLAGRLVATSRVVERALLTAMGQDRAQRLAATGAEALLLAGTATAVALPGSALAHAGLTHLPLLASAGLTQGPTITGTLAAAVLGGALVMAFALSVPSLREVPPPPQIVDRPRWRTAAARSSIDRALLALAATSLWQLRSRSLDAAGGVRVVAPVVCVVAVGLVGVRAVPWLLALAARAVHGLPTLTLPLATFEAARRPLYRHRQPPRRRGRGVGHLGGVAAATSEGALTNQADLQVGTDASLALAVAPTRAEARSIAAATGGVLSPVTARAIPLGRFVGSDGAAPRLLAFNTHLADEVLRGPADGGRSWAEVCAGLAPREPVSGIALSPGSAGIELNGQAPRGFGSVSVTPTAVLQDAAGTRVSVTGAPVVLDGRAHPVAWTTAPAGLQELVAVKLSLAAPAEALGSDDPTRPVTVKLRARGATSTVARWTGRLLGTQAPSGQTSPITVGGTQAGDGATLQISVRAALSSLVYSAVHLLTTSFAVPTTLPVVVSQPLADALRPSGASTLTAVVAGVNVPVRVRATVAAVPSEPGAVALLADQDTLSRILIGAGDLDSTPTTGGSAARAPPTCRRCETWVWARSPAVPRPGRG